jgi:hypothetical protein
VDLDGSWDPLQIGRLENVFRVARNTPYANMLAAAKRPPMPATPLSLAGFRECLQGLIEGHHVVTIIDTDGDATHATILEVDDEEFLFTEISRDGETMGDEARRLDSIRGLELNGPPQRSIERLLWSDKLSSL